MKTIEGVTVKDIRLGWVPWTTVIEYEDGHILIAPRPKPGTPIYTGTGDDEVGKTLTRKARNS